MAQQKQLCSTLVSRHKVGSTNISIYRNKNSFTLSWFQYGQRIRKTYKTLKEAKEQARRMKYNPSSEEKHLVGHELNEYQSCIDMLDQYANIHDLPDRPRMDILINEALVARKQKKDTFVSKTTHEVFDLWVEQKKANGCTQQTILDCNRAKKFCEMYPGYIHEITQEEVISWNNDLSRSKKYAERTRFNYQTAILGLFNFARDFKYLPPGEHSADILNKGKIKARKGVEEIGLWDVDQFRQMLHESLNMRSVGTNIKKVTLMVAIGGLAGLRVAEVARLHWEHILWNTDYIKVLAKDSKMKKVHRKVPISPALKSWIELAVKDAREDELTGSIFKCAVSYVTDRITELCKNRLRFEYVDNGLRHTCISSWVAMGHGQHQAAFWAGNSSSTVESNYLGEITKEEGEAWHSIMPPTNK
jgi:integrase